LSGVPLFSRLRPVCIPFTLVTERDRPDMSGHERSVADTDLGQIWGKIGARARARARAAPRCRSTGPDALKTLHKLVHGLAAGSDPMLTTTEAADLLGVSRPHVTKLLKSGKLAYRKTGNRHLVPASALQRFKDERDRKRTALEHLATHRRGVTSVRDVLDQLDRNQTLQPFIELARTRLL
jgi:excisionase family DNA binding protein